MSESYTSNAVEYRITLTNNPHQGVVVVKPCEETLHVIGYGLPKTVLVPGQSAGFEQRTYWLPIATLRVMFGMLPWRWARVS